MAVTGAQCLSSCLLTPGTVAEGLASQPEKSPARITLEHPSGTIDVIVDFDRTANGLDIKSAGLVRTARKLAAGDVFVSRSVWAGK